MLADVSPEVASGQGSPRASIPTLRTSRARVKAADVRLPELTWPGKSSGDLAHPGGAQAATLVARGDGADLDGNLLVHGDNLTVLAAIVEGGPTWQATQGEVKLAYLDPPFNTGARFGHYDDAVHTADWLEALQARLILIKKLLHRNGSVWLHLDDSEQHHGRCLMDEVFGADSFVATVIWQRRTSRDNRKAFSASHDYVHVYAPSGHKHWKSVRNGLANTGGFSNPDNDPRGPWRSVPLSAQAGHGTASQFYAITTPTGVVHDPPAGRCWTYTAPRFEELVRAGRVYWPKGGDGRPRLKRYEDEVEDLAPSTLWLASEVGDTAAAKKELLRTVGGKTPFDTPKPESLMERIIEVATDPGDLVLDPYAGSGTTAVVASRLNRRWIAIEAQEATLSGCAIPRLRAQQGSFASDGPSFSVLSVPPVGDSADAV
ncbi:site-specific DNA-methyltransferase [Nocardioides antri]|nr:site-specific DNA-methyltransferase [Nocardioides antri]